MKKKSNYFLVGITVTVVAGFAGLNMLAYNHARAMMCFAATGTRKNSRPEDLSFWSKIKVLLAGINVPRPDSEQSPFDLAPECRVLSIGVQDGVALESWYCNRGKETALVLLFHGYSTDKTTLLREARAFLDIGVSVMLVDFRGSGGSSESYTTIGVHEAEDVAAAVSYAETHLSHGRIILFGQSMGAVAILRAVHEQGILPDAVILEAVFDTLLSTVRNRFHAMGVPSFPGAELLVFWGGQQWGFDGFRHNPVDYAASLKAPILFMHGTDDQRARISEGRRVFDVVPGLKEFKMFHQTGHESYVSTNADEWCTTVREFISRVENNAVRGTALGAEK